MNYKTVPSVLKRILCVFIPNRDLKCNYFPLPRAANKRLQFIFFFRTGKNTTPSTLVRKVNCGKRDLENKVIYK